MLIDKKLSPKLTTSLNKYNYEYELPACHSHENENPVSKNILDPRVREDDN